MMWRNLIVLFIAFLFCAGITVNAEEELITRADYFKHVVQLMDWETKDLKTPEDYANLLAEKGIDIKVKDLGSTIPPEEKSIIVKKVIDMKLEKAKIVKAAEGIVNKAIVDEVMGSVSVLIKGKSKWTSVTQGMQLGVEDKIKTGSASYVTLRVGRFGRITIKENSELSLKELEYQPKRNAENIILNLAMGEVIIDARDIAEGSRFEIRTATTLAAVRGTIYSVKIINGGKMTSLE